MKAKTWILYICLTACVVLAMTGVLENRALTFVKGVSEKNFVFMGAVADIKLVLSSVGSVNVPFLSGEATEVNRALEDAQNYLFYVNIVSLVQLLLLTISKSVIIKAGIVILFLLSISKATRTVSSKLLIIVLTLNPGLTLCAVLVQQLSQDANIDFGADYQTELQAQVAKIQSEKSQLMQEHAKQMTAIDNGEKHMEFFRRLEEDVSYDVKKAKVDIKGDYSEIRILVKDAGETIRRKIFIFCTTVLFSLLLLPVGYSLLVYVIFKSVYKQNLIAVLKADEETVAAVVATRKTLFGKFATAAKSAAEEVKSDVVKSEQKPEAEPPK